MTHWEAWHGAYADPTSSLSRRLRIVQDHVRRFLDETAPRPVRVLSLCAGEGRDLLEVLAERDDTHRVRATLVELDPRLADRARASAGAFGGVEVRTADAGDPETHAAEPVADLVLLCGVLGNVSDADVEHTVAALPALCAPGARVIWTRTRRPPDLTPRVREWFVHNGFRELAFDPVPDSAAAVGVAELETQPPSALGRERLFTFVSASSNALTLDVYEHHADRYRASLGTEPDWHEAFLDRVVASLPPGASVLELGSGTGLDARSLRARGLAVQPSDAPSSFVEAMRREGLAPLRIDALTDDLGGPWDAVVAFAMMLHLTPDELAAVLDRVRGAVRPGGVLAISVKEGEGSSWSDHRLGAPRFYTYWRPGPLVGLLFQHGWTVELLQRRAGARDDWLLLIARTEEHVGG
jgi:SAM-dependent methyltransferase